MDDLSTEIRRYDVKDLLTHDKPLDEQTKELEGYIMDHVATGKWGVKAGRGWVISDSRVVPVILISQTPENHTKIERLLR